MSNQAHRTYGRSALCRVLLVAGSASLASLLIGCGLGSVATTPVTSATPVTAGAVVNGRVMGGQQPVAGVTLQLYTAGTTGYGSAAATYGSSFTTTQFGNFTFPNFPRCPSGNFLVFLVGTGGTPIGGSSNANLALIAGLGTCDNLPSVSYVNLNELSTIATVYALQGFMTGPTNIGAPPSNLTGITNAFAAINKVVNIGTGAASGPALPAGATLPVSEINALGNILQNCVNSAGGVASNTTTACGKLFSYTTVNAVAPTETITAALNIAKHPSVNVMLLNQQQASSPAFSPTLDVNSTPTDWTIAINYTGGGLNTPQTIISDASGNVYTTNPGNNSISKLDNTGAAVSGGNGYTPGNLSSPYGIAMGQQQGQLFITNAGNNNLVVAGPGGNLLLQISPGLSTPQGVAVDGAGAVWVANHGSNSVEKLVFDAFLTGATASSYSAGGVNTPTSIAISPK